jgi:hypothetical protein
VVTAQSVALFIHLLGVITLFIAIGLLQRGGARLRASTTAEEMRTWLSLVQTTRRMFPAAFILILLSGLYMADQSWSFDTPWIVVAIVSVVVMGALGGGVVGRGFAAIGRTITESGTASPDVARTVSNPALWIAATALNGIALGVLWLMAIKPGWTHSIVAVVVGGAIGGAVGSALARRDGGAGGSKAS